MTNGRTTGQRIPLSADAPTGAVSAWRYPQYGGAIVYRDHRGRMLSGSQRPGGGHYPKVPPATQYEEALHIARRTGHTFEFRIVEAEQARRLFKAYEASNSSLSPTQWLDTEIDRLCKLHDHVEMLMRQDPTLPPRQAERLAAAFVPLQQPGTRIAESRTDDRNRFVGQATSASENGREAPPPSAESAHDRD